MKNETLASAKIRNTSNNNDHSKVGNLKTKWKVSS